MSILEHKFGRAFFNFQEDVLGKLRARSECLLRVKRCAIVYDHYLNPH